MMKNEKSPTPWSGPIDFTYDVQKNKGKDTKNQRYTKSKSIKFLENLADQAARKRYPNVPYVAPRKYRDDSANGLTKCIIDFLRLSGYQAERISNTGRFLDNRKVVTNILGQKHSIGNSKWIPGTGTNGTADISATIYGRSVKIEVKINNDQQSKNQKSYQRFVEDAGGLYVIANSFEQFFEWYNLNFGSHEPV
jgi:hypothetical protein